MRALNPPKPAYPKPLGEACAPSSTELFAERVLRRAANLGLTKKELAARAALSRQTLDNVLQLGEQGDAAMPSVRTLLALAMGLRVHPYWLVEGLMAHVRVSMHLQAMMQGDRAGYVRDVSCPDACLVAPGTHFFKSWSAQVLGGQVWQGRKLVCWDDQLKVQATTLAGADVPVRWLVPDAREVKLDTAAGSDIIDGGVGFTAPMEPGVAVSHWLPTFADGTPAFSESAGIWVVVIVEPDAARRAAFPQASNSVELTRENLGRDRT